MTYFSEYMSPQGGMTLSADEYGIIALRFYGQKHFGAYAKEESTRKETDAILSAKRWLDAYFNGKCPGFTPPLHPVGTDFQLKVWNMLLKIPYGITCTYGELSKQLESSSGKRMSAQAVGGAVGRNPISVIIPCHRVIGANGNLTGYAGGIDKKISLLRLEGVDTNNLFYN